LKSDPIIRVGHFKDPGEKLVRRRPPITTGGDESLVSSRRLVGDRFELPRGEPERDRRLDEMSYD
jgi:hypothetical protein